MILDTNALSAWCDDDRELLAVLPSDRPLFLPVIVLNADSATARFYADVREELRRAKTPIPENDLWIAALALQHSLALLTRDTHFDRVPGIRRNGW